MRKGFTCGINYSEEYLKRIIYEVAESGIEFKDPRIRWISIQIDVNLWDEINNIAKNMRKDLGADSGQ